MAPPWAPPGRLPPRICTFSSSSWRPSHWGRGTALWILFACKRASPRTSPGGKRSLTHPPCLRDPPPPLPPGETTSVLDFDSTIAGDPGRSRHTADFATSRSRFPSTITSRFHAPSAPLTVSRTRAGKSFPTLNHGKYRPEETTKPRVPTARSSSVSRIMRSRLLPVRREHSRTTGGRGPGLCGAISAAGNSPPKGTSYERMRRGGWRLRVDPADASSTPHVVPTFVDRATRFKRKKRSWRTRSPFSSSGTESRIRRFVYTRTYDAGQIGGK